MISVISNTRYLELSLSHTFSFVATALPVTVVMNSLGISNPPIVTFFISLIQMWKEYNRKLWSNIFFFLFQDNNMSVKQNVNVKCLGEIFQAWKTWKVVHLTKMQLKNIVYLKISFQRELKRKRRILLFCNTETLESLHVVYFIIKFVLRISIAFICKLISI